MATSKRPYKRDDPSAPYGLTREGKPRKRPGPSKGGFKVPGSGRKKVTFSEQMDKWTEDLVEKILSNKPFQQINKFSGKRFSAPASLDLQWEVTKEWFRFKMRQHEREVAEQQIAAALTGTSSELHADRNLARVFAHDIDRRAAEGDPDALAMKRIIHAQAEAVRQQHAQQPEQAPMRLLERQEIIETNSAGKPASEQANPAAPSGGLPTSGGVGDGARHPPVSPSPFSTPDPKKREHGFRVDVPQNGGHLWWDANRMKWGVFDSDNTFHCWMADTEKAIAHSISNIPRGAGQRQEHPFEATKYDDWLYSTMRPDISATVSKPQVHLRRPRAR